MSFQDRLLTELRVVVAERGTTPTRRTVTKRRVALAVTATAAVTAGIGAGAPLLAGAPATSPAYAVEADGDMVTVKVQRWTDPDGLERRLEAAGISAEVDYLQADKTCRQPRFTPAPGFYQKLTEQPANEWAFMLTVKRSDFSGKTLVIEHGEASTEALTTPVKTEPGYSVYIQRAAGRVAPCEQIDIKR